MSLEQALADNTAALIRLATVMATGAEAAAPAPTPKAKKVVAAVTTEVTQVLLNEGDAPGTRYFHIPAHNTVYKQAPGDADCTMAGALIVSGTEYLAQKAELEKKFPSAAALATPVVVATVPTATAPVVTVSDGPTFETVIEKMRALHKALGNPGVQGVLTKYEATSVPGLKGKASNADLIAAIDAAAMGL